MLYFFLENVKLAVALNKFKPQEGRMCCSDLHDGWKPYLAHGLKQREEEIIILGFDADYKRDCSLGLWLNRITLITDRGKIVQLVTDGWLREILAGRVNKIVIRIEESIVSAKFDGDKTEIKTGRPEVDAEKI